MSQPIRLSLLLIAFLSADMSAAHAQPGAPTNVAATPSSGSAQVAYNAVPGAVSYKIYWSKSSPVTKQNADSPSPINTSGTQAAAAPLDNGTKYYIAVTAVNPSGESDLSNEVSVTPSAQINAQNANQPATAPSAPAQPTTNVGQSNDTEVQNPTMAFVPFTPTGYPVVALTNNLPNGTIAFDSAGVENLVKASCAGSAGAMEDGSTYVVINVTNLAGTPNAQRVASNNWYVYSKHKSFSTGFAGGWQLADFDGATRLFGARRILLLSILENDLTNYGPDHGPVIDYSLTITKQQATNVSDAVQLLGLVFPNKAAAGNPGDHPNYWACSSVPVAYKTSTVKFSLSYTAANNSPYTASQTFANEAKEHWDISFALPVKKASALQYNSTADTVTASQINKSALYAVFDWYPYPVDLKNGKFNYIPGIFAGVAMNSQPLHSLIFGASVGTKFAQFYAGALLLKQQNLSGLATGGTGSPTQVASATSYVYKPQFSVGIKISISAAASALKGSK